jgi:uncharacterized protein
MERFTIVVDESRTVSARRYPVESAAFASAAIVLAHGAGAGQESQFMVDMATGLSARGIDVVTFNFPYMESRRRVPDSNPTLEATWRAAVAAVRETGLMRRRELFIGGKSMGGRIASQVAARPETLAAPIAGLVFLGYPLHPPGRPEQRRDAHLNGVAAPMLFVQGERDAFGTPDEMRSLVAALPGGELRIVEGGDHSLAVRKGGRAGSGAALEAVMDDVAAWMSRIAG